MANRMGGAKPLGFSNEDFKMPTQSGPGYSEAEEDHKSHPGIRTANGASGAMADGFKLPRGTGPKEAPSIGSCNVRKASKKYSLDTNQS